MKGRILVGHEGVNATLEGKTKDIKNYIKKLKSSAFFKVANDTIKVIIK